LARLAQLRLLASPPASVVALAALVAWIGLLAVVRSAGFNAAALMRDPATMVGLPLGHGSLSTVGAMGWAFAAALCFAAHLTRMPAMGSIAGLLVVLGLDDALLLHEEVLPAVGIPQALVFAAYLGWAAAIARQVAAHAAELDAGLLAVACTAFGISMGLDVAAHAPVVFEDGPKLFGIAVLGWWAFRRARAALAAPAAAAAR
jgi:hypothetical protein